jgi:hypothetical protein
MAEEAPLRLRIKPTTEGAMFNVEVAPGASVLALKEATAGALGDGATAAELRLIYKGARCR